MQSQGLRTLANLPNELVVHSFKFAAATSREFCFCLSVVSSWTRDLALSYLLSTMILKTPQEVDRFIEYLTRHPKYATFIVNISLPSQDDYCLRDLLAVTELLQVCHRLVNLSVPGALLWYAHSSAFNFPHFQGHGLRLFIHDYSHVTTKSWLRQPNTLGIRSHMFKMITHIHTYYQFFVDQSYGIGAYVAKFPQLTHLAVDVVEPDLPLAVDDFSGALKSPTLTALVLVIDHQCPPNEASIRALRNGLCARSTDRLRVRVAFGGPLTVWRGDRRRWIDEVEGYSCDIWERAVRDTEEWTEHTD